MTKKLSLAFFIAIHIFSNAQWTPLAAQNAIRAAVEGNKFVLDLNLIRSQLNKAQETGRNAAPLEISLPVSEGKTERFYVYSAPVMEKSLADRYQLGSYIGTGIDDPEKRIRFSVSPQNFQGMIMKNQGMTFIAPADRGSAVYSVYQRSGKSSKSAFICGVNESTASKAQINQLLKAGSSFTNRTDFSVSSDRKYRTLRLALSVTGEYTKYFGGVSEAMSAINATLTRVNGIFERDFAVHLNLQNFPQLIYTDPANDPYSDPKTGVTRVWGKELQNTLTSTIGNGAYDIGHLFGASASGGDSGCIGCVCTDDTPGLDDKNKGSGFTSLTDAPQGDYFDVDFVSHEMAHQLGARHTFSHQIESGSTVQVEPGSGSTIMGYAGITSADVQSHTDPYFHGVSIAEVQKNMASVSCDVETAIANNPPVLKALPELTIPKSTAFVLTAEATDAEKDPLTYTWEQTDSATSPVNVIKSTNTTGPLFRSFPPSTSPSRYFPKLSSVLAGKLTIPEDWETVSDVTRAMNFLVTVRDNHVTATEQQTQSASQKINVGADGPFKITATQVFTNVQKPFTWDVVNTSAAPYNVTNVKIDYTKDNGTTWSVLSASTPNDGSELLDFSALAPNTSVIVRVSAIGNVFYAVAPVNVSVMAACEGSAPANLKVSGISISQATVQWAQVINATYLLRYKKSSDTAWSEVKVSAHNYQLTTLEEGVSYDVQVAAVCGGVPGAFSTTVVFSTSSLNYCASVSNDATSGYISSVKITPSSGSPIINSSSSASNYSDYTQDASRTITLARGTTNNSIIVSKGWLGLKENLAVTAWIDFNRDGTFDTSEKILSSAASQTTPVSAVFSVPAEVYAGDKTTRMRVVLSNGDANSACLNLLKGEVEDYSVKFTAQSTSSEDVVQVYPIPASEILNITHISPDAVYEIYNMAGRLAMKGKISGNRIRISHLSIAAYILRITDGGKSVQIKFIKD